MISQPAENQSQHYTEKIDEFGKMLFDMDFHQNKINSITDFFFNAYKENEIILNDLLQKWKDACFYEQNRLVCAYSADSIIKRAKNEGILIIKEKFYSYILSGFPILYMTLSEGHHKKIDELLDIWEANEIYAKEQIDCIRFLMNLEFNPEFDNSELQNDILFEKIKEGSLTIDENLYDFCSLRERLKENPNDNIIREKYLKKTKEMIHQQNKIFQKHTQSLEELEKMLDKINQYKLENDLKVE